MSELGLETKCDAGQFKYKQTDAIWGHTHTRFVVNRG